MPIKTAKISNEQAEKILKIEENHFSDLKAIEIAPAKLSRHICAFANADGGELFIGIDEDKQTDLRHWRGFGSVEAANAHLQVFDPLFPFGQFFDYTFLECDGKIGYVLYVEIKKTPDIKIASDSKAYLRRGAQSLPQDTAEQMDRLKLNKGITSFETQTIDADKNVIANSYVTIEFILQVIPTTEPDAWFKKQALLKEDKPTVAGVLLFADEPAAYLAKRCGIKIYRYKTSDAEGTRDTLAFNPISVEAHLYKQIEEAVSKALEIIQSIKIMGPNGLENAQYPQEALHEIITNAVLHRDYSIQDDIHIKIFENRIEVFSPGTLAGHVTVENILEERYSRNGSIVRLINKFPNPPNKDIGEGLNTAFEAMRKLRLRDPIISQRPNGVLVTIRHEPMASPEEIIMEFLENNEKINNTQAREICHIGSENKMKRVFEKMIDSNMIERIPELKGRAIAYRKI